MRFSLPADLLANALAPVASLSLARKGQPILGHVLLSADQDGVLTLTGADTACELVVRVPGVQVDEPGVVTAHGKRLRSVLDLLGENEAIFQSLGDTHLQLRCGACRYSFSRMADAEFPRMADDLDVDPADFPAATLHDGIEQVRRAMASTRQNSRHALKGVLVELHPERLRVVATDGFRLGMFTESGNVPGVREQSQGVLPRAVVPHVLRVLDSAAEGSASLALGARQGRLSTIDRTLTFSLLDGAFPSYSALIPSTLEASVSADRGVLYDAVCRVSLCCENDELVCIGAEADELSMGTYDLRGGDAPQESAEEVVPAIMTEGMPFRAAYRANYLSDMLAVMPEGNVSFRLGSGNHMLVGAAMEDGRGRHLVMPMTIRPPAAA